MKRAMKLKRIHQGSWKSADGEWLFGFWEASERWHIHDRDDSESDGWSDEPATFQGFETLWEACEWAAKEAKRRKDEATREDAK